MYETYYDKLPAYFGQENIQLHYMDTDCFILSAIEKVFLKDVKNNEDLFDFDHLNELHEFFSNKNKKVIGKFKIETPEIIWIDEFVCPRSKRCLLKGGEDF